MKLPLESFALMTITLLKCQTTSLQNAKVSWLVSFTYQAEAEDAVVHKCFLLKCLCLINVLI